MVQPPFFSLLIGRGIEPLLECTNRESNPDHQLILSGGIGTLVLIWEADVIPLDYWCALVLLNI